jgi:hypothetical protein
MTSCKIFLLSTVFLFFEYQSNGQTAKIVGIWRSPLDLGGVSYTFENNGIVKYEMFTCVGQSNLTGRYTVSKDTIEIKYNSPTPPHLSSEKLLIIGDHKIKVNNYMFIYDRIMGQTFSLTDKVFIVGQYCWAYHISFDRDKATLRLESSPFLDSLVTFLAINKSVAIEIRKYGDTADAKHNTKLSKKRAESILDYLVDKGISKKRLTTVGYRPIGTKYEIDQVKTQEVKQKLERQNNRTELKILRTDFKEM